MCNTTLRWIYNKRTFGEKTLLKSQCVFVLLATLAASPIGLMNSQPKFILDEPACHFSATNVASASSMYRRIGRGDQPKHWNMTIAPEEIFGPVLSVITYETEEDAIRIANDTSFGLHAFVSGTDIQRARRVTSQIQAGRVAINGMLDDQQAPFGGFKHSGVGREFGTYGIEAFLEPRRLLPRSSV